MFLLIAAVAYGLSSTKARTWTLWLLGWAAFNVIFHNLWGDEFFLYSPHWSWALTAVVAISVSRMRWPLVTAAVVLLAVAQVSTFGVIGQMLRAP
jgi:hypothetical protein